MISMNNYYYFFFLNSAIVNNLLSQLLSRTVVDLPSVSVIGRVKDAHRAEHLVYHPLVVQIQSPRLDVQCPEPLTDSSCFSLTLVHSLS